MQGFGRVYGPSQDRTAATDRSGFKGPKPLLSRQKRRKPLRGTMREKIREAIDEKLAKGKTIAEIKEDAGLTKTEREVLDVHVLAEEQMSNQEAAEVMGKTPGTISNALQSIANKILGSSRRRDDYMKPKEGKAVKRIKEIIEKKLSEGKSLDGIKEEAGLNENEVRVLDTYVLAEDRITGRETAERLGIAKVTVGKALRGIECRLLGRRPSHRYIEIRRKMSDRDIIARIREMGVDSRSRLSDKDYALRVVADERGILDRLFPSRRSMIIEELGKAWEAAIRERGREQVFSELTDFEMDMMNRFVICEKATRLKAFADHHGIPIEKAYHAMKKLARKLLGEVQEKPPTNRDKLEKCVRGLDGDRLAELKALMNEKELRILDERILCEASERKTMEELKAVLQVSRQALSQLEQRVLERIERWKECGTFRRRGMSSKRALEIRELIQRELSEEKSLDDIKIEAGLNGIEGKVLDIYILAEERITQKEAGVMIGRGHTRISVLVRRIAEKVRESREESAAKSE